MKKEAKILVVDDQIENLEVIVNIVEKIANDMTVFQALTGEMAFKIACHEIPDLIITDWEMPGMNGIELISKLKAEERTVDIPIIMCTGIMTKSENLSTALDAGAVDYIRKPVDEIELKSRLKSMLQLSESLRTIKQQHKEIAIEMEKSESLLLNILPKETAEELKLHGTTKAKNYESVSVLFTDFKGFTMLSERLTAQELVNELDFCYKAFDKIMDKHGIEKIKTIGDAYMAAGGVPKANTTHPIDTIKAAMEIRDFMIKYKVEREEEGREAFELRIGIHTGPVVAGVVGIRKFAYDIWGDAVNTAARMESSGAVGMVNVSGSTYELIKSKVKCTYRGKVPAKNKGEIDMYFIDEIL